MTTTPCTIVGIFIGLVMILVFSFILYLNGIRFTWISKITGLIKRMEIQIPKVPRYVWFGLKYAVPVLLVIVFFKNLHFVDCKTKKPLTTIASIKKCNCEIPINKIINNTKIN